MMTPEAVADLVAEVAPELRGLYVVFASATNDDLAEMAKEQIVGCTTPNMDRRLGRFISPWRGRQPCMLLADRELQEEAARRVGSGVTLAQAERWVFGAVALHEAAHILERPPPYWGGADGPGEYPPELLKEMAVWLATPEKDLPPPPSPEPWFGHGALWLRILCHIAWRARRKGLCLSTPVVVNIGGGSYYGLGNPQVFEASLGNEMERCADLPFEQFLYDNPPEAYSAVWDEVKVEWYVENRPALAALRTELQRPAQ
jgi:hypothetical protein